MSCAEGPLYFDKPDCFQLELMAERPNGRLVTNAPHWFHFTF